MLQLMRQPFLLHSRIVILAFLMWRAMCNRNFAESSSLNFKTFPMGISLQNDNILDPWLGWIFIDHGGCIREVPFSLGCTWHVSLNCENGVQFLSLEGLMYAKLPIGPLTLGSFTYISKFQQAVCTKVPVFLTVILYGSSFSFQSYSYGNTQHWDAPMDHDIPFKAYISPEDFAW